jgi:hypothetical protein
MSRVNFMLYVIATAGLFLAALGLFPDRIRSVYLFGLLVLLFTSGSVFARLFMSLTKSSTPAA